MKSKYGLDMAISHFNQSESFGISLRLKVDIFIFLLSTKGQALLCHHLSSALGDQRKEEFLQRGISLLKPGLHHLKGRKYSFLGGDAGILAVAAVIYDKLGLKSDSKDCLKRFALLHSLSSFNVNIKMLKKKINEHRKS